tara:strand:+ start:98 stop:883 length:786 start_codon:yes stop_codon:yes gene_type:complete
MPVNIKGREYKTVAERLNEFHEKYEHASISTEVMESGLENVVRIKATIKIPTNQDWVSTFTGHAEEDYADGFINSTSALENAETSAIGRALASAGYGGHEFASADELTNALKNQEKRSKTPKVSSGSSKPIPKTNVDRIESMVGSNFIDFGKHKGDLWSEVPKGYLEFMAKMEDESDRVVACREELLRRKGSPTKPPVKEEKKKSSLQEIADDVVKRNVDKIEKAKVKEDEIVGAIEELDKKFAESIDEQDYNAKTEDLPF